MSSGINYFNGGVLYVKGAITAESKGIFGKLPR